MNADTGEYQEEEEERDDEMDEYVVDEDEDYPETDTTVLVDNLVEQEGFQERVIPLEGISGQDLSDSFSSSVVIPLDENVDCSDLVDFSTMKCIICGVTIGDNSYFVCKNNVRHISHQNCVSSSRLPMWNRGVYKC